MKFKRFVTAILSLVMVAGLSVPAFAYELKSFSDVAEDHWAYKAIMRSVELGLIAGTKAPDANGVGEFNPNANMTRAQFIVVTMRAVAPDVLNELNNAGQGETWYSNATQLAVQLGILEWTDFGGLSETANMNKAITREEMAHILSNATGVLGQTPSSKISTSRITDWSKVSSEYQLDVINAYSLGMLTGYANPGNFGPKDNMSRAQACAVLNRLLDVDSRANVDTSTPTQKPSENNNQSSYIGATIKGQTTEAQTWKEGEKHSVPKVGDTIIAKNGTKYTIQATYVDGRCILGFGIPCDIWTGTVAPSGKVVTVANGAGWWGDDYSSMLRNTATGEVHTSAEWSALLDGGLIKLPTTDGTYNGQVSGYHIWEVYQGAFGTEAGWSFKTESK